MSKVTLANVGSLIDATTAANTINSNSAAIVAAVENTLSRDGTQPNPMGSNLDMNSYRILNLPAPADSNDPVRLQDMETFSGGGTITVNPLPTGGTAGQILTKNSGTNYDATWKNAIAWVKFTGSTAAILNSSNISSVVRNGGGSYTVTFSIVMPSNYAYSLSCETDSLTPYISAMQTGTLSTGQCIINMYNIKSYTASDPNGDPITVSMIIFGN